MRCNIAMILFPTVKEQEGILQPAPQSKGPDNYNKEDLQDRVINC